MREMRVLWLMTVASIPMVWSSTLSGTTRAEIVNQALSVVLLGVLPLLSTLLLWNEAFKGADVDVRYGASRRLFALRTLVRVNLFTLSFALGGAVASIVFLRGVRDPQLGGDLTATLPVAAAAALSVTCLLASIRAALGRAGLCIALLLVWLVGSLKGPAALVLPSGHIGYLLGVGAELPFPAWGSFAALYAFATATGLLLLARTPR